MPDGAGQATDDAGALSVSQITALIKESLESSFRDVWVVGEIGRCTRAASGHFYLSLKDDKAVLNAVIWRGTASAMRFEPEEGLEVIARGSIDVYAPRGSYQLVISRIEPRGAGALQIAFEKLKARLAQEGLFRSDLKKPLPRFPARIGIVTSPTGAALRDIINVIGRRYSAVELFLMPTLVQGGAAAGRIAAAIDMLNAEMPELDLMIVGRGGGSLEDLWAFNEETVARAIHRSRIPVISAVGHEIDFTIADFVADVRAATPTEAAEIAVPDRVELTARLEQSRHRLANALEAVAERGRRRLDAVMSRYVFRRPLALLQDRAQGLDDLLARLQSAASHRLGLLREALSGTGRRLDALSPLRVLERGYSLTLGPEGAVLRSVEGLRTDTCITTVLHRGRIESRVTSVSNREPPAREDINSA